ncbi:hypothetical protein IAT38_002806 [Cryptococcus sp. DSM 104549]
MNPRRRPSNTSSATGRSGRESSLFKNVRSPSVSSAAKTEDDEDGTPRRNTRLRNPLPPQSGPLFPPLPPKQPKGPRDSPSSRSPAVRDPSGSLAPAATISGSTGIEVPAGGAAPGDAEDADDSALVVEDEEGDTDGKREDDKNRLASASNTSLTPPPPTSEDAAAEADGADGTEAAEAAQGGAADADQGENGAGEDDWETYHRNRAVRGFGESKPGEVKAEPEGEAEDATDAEAAADATADATAEAEAAPDADAAAVDADTSTADTTVGGDEATPIRTRTGKIIHRGISTLSASGANTPASRAGSTPDTAGRSASRQGRKRRGEEQLLLDDHLLPAEIRRTAADEGKRDDNDEEEDAEEGEAEGDDEVKGEEEEEEADEGEGEDFDDGEEDIEEGKDITRCVCKREDIDVMMIQCDKCNVWQHGDCMGIWGDEEAPDEYFCEECKPERHQALRKWMRSRGRNAPYVAPLPDKLEQLHNERDRFPPSQSKRWTDPSVIEPPPATKPLARSHHKKEPLTPIDTGAEGRRSTRGRRPPSSSREKPPSSGKVEKEGKRRGGQAPASAARKESLTVEESDSAERSSGSPQPSAAVKKRSTMNSRDAAYEEAVKAAMEASRKEMMGEKEGEEQEESTVAAESEKGRSSGKRRRAEEEEEEKEGEKEKPKKGKRRKEEVVPSAEPVDPALAPSSSSGASKPKHPNQYTYRPKPPSTVGAAAAAPSPSRPQGTTPVPSSIPTHHDHGTRRAGALANAPVVYHPLSTEHANNLSWGLPDHLSQFADLLPAPNPVALDVPAPRILSYLPRNHFHNQRYGPFSEERDAQGKLPLPEEQQGRETVGGRSTQLEPPTRIKYPAKRVTVSDMKKRVRTVLEYVGKMQVDDGKRLQRAKDIGIRPYVKAKAKEHEEGEGSGANGHVDADGDAIMDEREPAPPAPVDTASRAPSPAGEPPQPRSQQLMAELTQQLIAFQESFSNGIGFPSPVPHSTDRFVSNGFASAPPTPALGYSFSVPPTPTIPAPEPAEKLGQAGTMEAVPAPEVDVGAEETTVDVVGKGEGLDVYRAGEVTRIVTVGETEREVAEKVEEMIEG